MTLVEFIVVTFCSASFIFTFIVSMFLFKNGILWSLLISIGTLIASYLIMFFTAFLWHIFSLGFRRK